jgi:hypothetical protein
MSRKRLIFRRVFRTALCAVVFTVVMPFNILCHAITALLYFSLNVVTDLIDNWQDLVEFVKEED